VRALGASLVVLLAFLVLEVVVGLATGSLALLSDAGHMLTDVLGSAMALAAIVAARRGAPDDRRTFGLYRAEVLAALANAVLLFGVAGWVLVEAVTRFADPPAVPGLPVVLTAAAGLAANLVVFALLRPARRRASTSAAPTWRCSPTPSGRSACSWPAPVTLLFGWRWADPLVAVAIALFVLPAPGPWPARPSASWCRRRRRTSTSRACAPTWPRSTACTTCTTCTCGR
jgi:cobalt-zinc-cadmium efflux system protein